MSLKQGWRLLAAVAVTLGASSAAHAGSHSWRIHEIFSNADGTIQFIEMEECCGSSVETALGGKWIRSAATGNQFDFPASISGDTANQYLLLATAGFAALPGAPTPDYIISDNFFATGGDTLTYWMYPPATMTFGAGALPLDGINSLDRDGTTGLNSPTNFAGVTGTVDASGGTGGPQTFVRADANQNGAVEIADGISILAFLFQSEPTSCQSALDANDDGGIDISDAISVLSYLFSGGPAPSDPFPPCGEDPTADALTCSAFAACP